MKFINGHTKKSAAAVVKKHVQEQIKKNCINSDEILSKYSVFIDEYCAKNIEDVKARKVSQKLRGLNSLLCDLYQKN